MITIVAAVGCIGAGLVASGAASSQFESRKSESLAAHRVNEAERRAAAIAAFRESAWITPASGATNVAPNAKVVVELDGTYLESVRLTAANGETITGVFAPSGDRWASADRLAYGTTYQVAVSALLTGGVRAETTSTFSTLVPTATVGVSVFPSDGLEVGVGQPVVFRFDRAIDSESARAAVLAHLHVVASRPVAGGWHWFNNQELHYRPRTYWRAHERVIVGWNLDGWNVGADTWGGGRGLMSFTIGNARVSFADLTTHLMGVTENGKRVATYPISGGKPSDPTMGGAHIVMDRQSVVRMNSATNGVPVDSPDGYDEIVYSNVHISDSGEYVHAAPWSVADQGRENVSHGCINLSPTDALAFFAFSRVGDVILVGGSPRGPELGDHGVMDWSTPWDQFTPAPVARKASPDASAARAADRRALLRTRLGLR